MSEVDEKVFMFLSAVGLRGNLVRVVLGTRSMLI